jgi:hypothetical protein
MKDHPISAGMHLLKFEGILTPTAKVLSNTPADLSGCDLWEETNRFELNDRSRPPLEWSII